MCPFVSSMSNTIHFQKSISVLHTLHENAIKNLFVCNLWIVLFRQTFTFRTITNYVLSLSHTILRLCSLSRSVCLKHCQVFRVISPTKWENMYSLVGFVVTVRCETENEFVWPAVYTYINMHTGSDGRGQTTDTSQLNISFFFFFFLFLKRQSSSCRCSYMNNIILFRFR